MAVTRRTRIAPIVVEAPTETTTVRRRRSVTEVAPVAETSTTQVTRRRAPAKPSAELTQALKIIDTFSPEPVEDEEGKRSITDYDKIINEYKERATTPKNAIRAMCVSCMGGMIAEVRRCTSLGCPLYPFRTGENPFHALSKHNPNNPKKAGE
jgi:hypothetical protein